jgi:ubiquinone/menaquinone biosynthesis C-methylase UbiE
MSFNALDHLKNNWGQGVEGNIPEHWFQEILKDGLKILEIGFGKGNFLKRLEDSHKDIEICGVECSEQNLRYARTELKLKKSNMLLFDVSTQKYPWDSGHFDVVVLLEVLEHVLSPMYVILEIQRVLKKDGLFIYSWPEERLISGIGMEEDQSKRRHGVGFHSFPYPGLFRYDNMRVFFNQMFFKIIDEERKEYHIFFKMLNVKHDRVHILDVVNGDYSRQQLYGDIETNSKFKDLQ